MLEALCCVAHNTSAQTLWLKGSPSTGQNCPRVHCSPRIVLASPPSSPSPCQGPTAKDGHTAASLSEDSLPAPAPPLFPIQAVLPKSDLHMGTYLGSCFSRRIRTQRPSREATRQGRKESQKRMLTRLPLWVTEGSALPGTF